MVIGTVWRTGGGVYEVALDTGERVEASLRGRLKLEARTGDQVVIGDRVAVAEGEDGARTIERIEPREKELVRGGLGGRRARVLAANVDTMLIVVAVRKPNVHLALVDRLLIVAESNGLTPVLVLNKMDLPGTGPVADSLVSRYRDSGYSLIRASAVSGVGLDLLRSVIAQGISALVGPSGVGKSSLLNAIQPDLHLRTGELSRKVGRGRHTTVGSRLIPLRGGGLVADTPGFSDVSLWGVKPGELDRYLPEFSPYLGSCRFRSCTHIHEPDCAIQQAVAEGSVVEGRYESYKMLFEEAG